MIIENTKLEGVLRVTPPTIFEDFRGSYTEIYNEKIYKEFGVLCDFVQDDISISKNNISSIIFG